MTPFDRLKTELDTLIRDVACPNCKKLATELYDMTVEVFRLKTPPELIEYRKLCESVLEEIKTDSRNNLKNWNWNIAAVNVSEVGVYRAEGAYCFDLVCHLDEAEDPALCSWMASKLDEKLESDGFPEHRAVVYSSW